MHSGHRVSQPKAHKELHKRLKNHRERVINAKSVAGFISVCVTALGQLTPRGTLHQPALPRSQGMLPCTLGLQHGWEARTTGNNCSHTPVQVKSVSLLPPQAPEIPEDHLGCIATRCTHHTSS